MSSNKSRVLGLVVARAGSKGIPGKNMRTFGDAPLAVQAIKFGLDNSSVSSVFVSSDIEELKPSAQKLGAEMPFFRPKQLCLDETAMIDVVDHVVDFLEAENRLPEFLDLLQPTSPFRRHSDLNDALTLLLEDENVDSVVSVEAVPEHYSPAFLMKIEDGKLVPFLSDENLCARRQDATRAFSRNGQFYVTRISSFLRYKSIYGKTCLPFPTCHPAVNLDTLDDWDQATKLLDSSTDAT